VRSIASVYTSHFTLLIETRLVVDTTRLDSIKAMNCP
jgi:hypothetical protein